MEGMRFRGHVGTTAQERAAGNDFVVTLGYDTDTSKAGLSDSLSDAVDYSKVFESVGLEFRVECCMIENLAHRIMSRVIADFSPLIWNVSLRICKRYPSVDGQLEQSVIELHQ